MVSRSRPAQLHRRFIEALEPRELLSGLSKIYLPKTRSAPPPVPHSTIAFASKGVIPHSITPPGFAFTPSQIRRAYGIDQIMFGDIVGDGAGQTIAIVDAYHYPTAWEDLQAFNLQFGLPDPPSFQQVAQDGSQNFPVTDPAGPGSPNGTWAQEAALDIQWAHAMAPAANILLVEANDNSYTNLVQNAVNWARKQPGVSVVSMSFGGSEFSGELAFDSIFTTPAGHQGVTFAAATGDSGQPGSYPAYSPNVVAVGGTSLFLNNGEYSNETGWSGSGGGISTFQNKPSYQSSVTQSNTRRTTPDISMVANPNTGVAVYDSWDFPGSPWFQVGGTSLATPLFAGLVAVANQGRELAGLGTLDGRNDLLPRLYGIPGSDYHDIISGNNGSGAATGYDLITGRGTPAGFFIADVVNNNDISGEIFEDRDADGEFNSGDVALPGVEVFLDANDNGLRDLGGTETLASGTLNLTISENNMTGLTATQTVSRPGPVSDVNVTVNIAHTRVGQLTLYLIAPDNTQIALVARQGGNGDNFTNTTFDDEAGTSITSGFAPYTGTFRPVPGLLSTFDGLPAAGAWKLKVTDTVGSGGAIGTLLSWSITVTSADEASMVTEVDGKYAFTGLLAGDYKVRKVPPTLLGFLNQASALSVNVTWQKSGVNFAHLPSTLDASGPNDLFHIWREEDSLMIGKSLTPTDAIYAISLGSIANLRFNLGTAGSKLIVDYIGGTPLPLAGLTVDGGGLINSTLAIIGQATPQAFTMTDTEVGTTDDSPRVAYQNLGMLQWFDSTVYLTGTLSTIQFLIIDSGTIFYFPEDPS